MDNKTVIFFGPSGSGKGTQANLLIQALKEKGPQCETLYIETGKLFRNFFEKENYTSSIASLIVDKGELLPDFMATWAWTEFLAENYTGKENLIFDGVSRNLNQAQIFDSIVNFYKLENPTIVEIKVSKEWATKRLLERGRHDDTPEKIEKRLSWYFDKTSGALDFFRNKQNYKYLGINGERGIEDVHEALMEELKIS